MFVQYFGCTYKLNKTMFRTGLPVHSVQFLRAQKKCRIVPGFPRLLHCLCSLFLIPSQCLSVLIYLQNWSLNIMLSTFGITKLLLAIDASVFSLFFFFLFLKKLMPHFNGFSLSDMWDQTYTSFSVYDTIQDYTCCTISARYFMFH